MKKLLLLLLLTFGLNIGYSQYCAAGPSSTFYSNVDSVALSGSTMNINYAGCPGVTGVQDLTAMQADFVAGSMYTVDVQFGTCGGNYGGSGAVWIDFDGNEAFDAGEVIGTSAGTPGGWALQSCYF